jgi:uncharacterized phage protein (TIGR01671 family)
MREIIFKAKRLDNGKWIQGHLFTVWEDAFILWGATNDTPNMKQVDPETVCQYTGLTDKNGNKIWECDINEDLGYVFWNKDFAAFQWCYPNGDVMEFEDEKEWCIIIGNIFDNSELLTK